MNKPNSLCIIVKGIELEIIKSKYNMYCLQNNVEYCILQEILMQIYPKLIP